MERQPQDEDFFRQHNSAILEQQRRFRLNLLRLQREQQQHRTAGKNCEEETRGTSQEELEHRGKTIALLPPKSDILNIYVNNKLVGRSLNGFEQIIKSVKTMPKRERGMSDAAVVTKVPPFSMIIPFMEGKHRERKSSRVKLDKLPNTDVRNEKVKAIYHNKQLERAGTGVTRRRIEIEVDLPSRRKITERMDTSGELTRKLEESHNLSQMPGSSYLPQGRSVSKRISSRKAQGKSPIRRQLDRSRECSPEQRSSPDCARQQKIESILRRRSETLDFSVFLGQFAHKMNYPSNAKFFIFKSHDEHVRRLLLKQGWIENSLPQSQAYHLKWTISDASDSYCGLVAGQQFFNHFANGYQLTSKIGLHTHFYRPNIAGVAHLYPRSFDLQQEKEDFVQEYERTAVLCLLKKHARYFRERGVQSEDASKKLQQVLSEGDFNAEVTDQRLQTNIPVLVQMCMYLENWRCLRLQLPEPYTIENKMVGRLIGFSRVLPPYEHYSAIKRSELQF